MAENPQLSQNISAFGERALNEAEEFRWQSEKVDLISHTIKNLAARQALADVGCFTGMATAQYGSLGFARVVGFDASVEALKLAAGRGIDTRRWLIGETACPADDNEFDVIVAADIIEHLIDTDGFLHELGRILGPGGFLIVTTPNLVAWRSRLRMLLGKPPLSYPGASPTVQADEMVDRNHIRIANSREWQALFRAHGFTVIDIKGWSLMHAVDGGFGVRVRKMIDKYLTKKPTLAFGLMFLLRR
jgi:2-polyprenyl-3-methyl-5-hydroxy-6-metoxy-1,4-benzoquinol methylase